MAVSNNKLICIFIVVALLFHSSFYVAYVMESYFLYHFTTEYGMKPGKKTTIPKIIHQTYKTHDENDLPAQWLANKRSFIKNNPDFAYMFWDDRDLRELVKSDFPNLLSTFDNYPYDIQRVDLGRYLVLYKYGGVYSDLDYYCRKSLRHLYNSKTLENNILFHYTTPFGLSNDFIISSPRHEFLLHLIINAPFSTKNLILPYPTILHSTGPLFINRMYFNYFYKDRITVIKKSSFYEYVIKTKGNSWHQWDSYIIMSFFHHPFLSTIALFLLLLGLGTTIVYMILYVKQKKKVT